MNSQLKPVFKPGDLVYSTDNIVWGLAPMIVVSATEDFVSCKAPDMCGSVGGFLPSSLELVSNKRASRIMAYLKLVTFEERLKSKLFG